VITVRRAGDRGRGDHGWLLTRHTFSFADYYDPRFMGFRALRVINEDTVAPGAGFPTHAHRDMEIVSYVLAGALEHKDSLGTGSVIRPGDVQRMSAGTGVRHSEFNHSAESPVHFYQIWIEPARRGLEPGYEQRRIPAAEKRGRLRLVAAPDGSAALDGPATAGGAVTIHQDARLYATVLERGESVAHAIAPGRHAWVQVLRGALALEGEPLAAGDGAAVTGTPSVTLVASAPAEALVFDLA
jgi:redox-sensitive bicupin YhaK (pirin superfamily)